MAGNNQETQVTHRVRITTAVPLQYGIYSFDAGETDDPSPKVRYAGTPLPITLFPNIKNWLKSTKAEHEVILSAGCRLPSSGYMSVWTGIGGEATEKANAEISTAVVLECGHVMQKEYFDHHWTRLLQLRSTGRLWELECPICHKSLTCSSCKRSFKPAGLPPIELRRKAAAGASPDPFALSSQSVVPLTSMERSFNDGNRLCHGCFSAEIMDHFPRIPARCPIDEERHNEMYHQKCRAIVEAVVPTLAHYRSDFQEQELQHLRKWLLQDLTTGIFSDLSSMNFLLFHAEWDVGYDLQERRDALRTKACEYLKGLLDRVKGLHAWEVYSDEVTVMPTEPSSHPVM